jgi:hypothetical protein
LVAVPVAVLFGFLVLLLVVFAFFVLVLEEVEVPVCANATLAAPMTSDIPSMRPMIFFM